MVFTGKQEVGLVVYRLCREFWRETLLHLSKTYQFPTVPWKGLVDLGSWCPSCLLPINHQLQAVVQKNFWFPAHTHSSTTTCIYSHACSQKISYPIFKSGQLKAKAVSQSLSQFFVCSVRPRLHGTVECNLGSAHKVWFCFCSGDIAWNKRVASYMGLMCKSNILIVNVLSLVWCI